MDLKKKLLGLLPKRKLNPDRCDPTLYAKGETVMVTHTLRTAHINHWVSGACTEVDFKIDWHWAGGRAQILCPPGKKVEAFAALQQHRAIHDHYYREEVLNLLLPNATQAWVETGLRHIWQRPEHLMWWEGVLRDGPFPEDLDEESDHLLLEIRLDRIADEVDNILLEGQLGVFEELVLAYLDVAQPLLDYLSESILLLMLSQGLESSPARMLLYQRNRLLLEETKGKGAHIPYLRGFECDILRQLQEEE